MNIERRKELENTVVANLDLTTLDTEYLVDLALAKERKRVFANSELVSITAEIENRAIKYQEDRHIKFSEFKGCDSGFVNISVATSLEVLNFNKLKESLGNIIVDKIREKPVEVKYSLDTNFKKAVIALILNDYEKDKSIEEVLDTMDLVNDSGVKALLLKKIKGDYKKDKELIYKALNLPPSDDLDIDTELYMIYQIKNFELIRAYFDIDKLDKVKEELEKYITVSEVPKISLKEI